MNINVFRLYLYSMCKIWEPDTKWLRASAFVRQVCIEFDLIFIMFAW